MSYSAPKLFDMQLTYMDVVLAVRRHIEALPAFASLGWEDKQKAAKLLVDDYNRRVCALPGTFVGPALEMRKDG